MPSAPDAVRLRAPAKVNLRLRVLAREESGFHSLETLFCAVSLADEVRVRRSAPGVALRVEGGVDTGPPERNLAVRAAERFFEALGEDPAVAVELRKEIPAQAGLGGGSSDAAAVLRALNLLHGEPLPPESLLRLAGALGSDVPFFLSGSPLALAWSRGERLLALPPLPPRPLLIVHPGEGVSTAEAFAGVGRARGGAYTPEPVALPLEALGSWEGVCALAGNDFEAPALERIPGLAGAKREMERAGAGITLLSGSGACLFGLFWEEAERGAAEVRIRGLGLHAWRAETLSALPEPQVDRPVASG